MVWFFIAGFISGAVGIVKFANWYATRLENRRKNMEGRDNGTDSF